MSVMSYLSFYLLQGYPYNGEEDYGHIQLVPPGERGWKGAGSGHLEEGQVLVELD